MTDCGVIEPYQSFASFCQLDVVEWSSPECKSGDIEVACETCSSAATSLCVTAFTACISLVAALIGAQVRIGVRGDSPVQKLLGMSTELFGTLSLAASLHIFENHCYWHLRKAFRFRDLTATFWLGPGFYCYAVCIVSGFVRTFVHILVPLPGRGKGFGFFIEKPPQGVFDIYFFDNEDKLNGENRGNVKLKDDSPARSFTPKGDKLDARFMSSKGNYVDNDDGTLYFNSPPSLVRQKRRQSSSAEKKRVDDEKKDPDMEDETTPLLP